jgi:hypothetical protein
MLWVSNCIIEDITFSVSSSQGITNGCSAIRLEGDSTDQCEGNVITKCNIDSFGKLLNSSFNYGHGILFDAYCKKNVIDSNYIHDCQGHIFIDDNSEENIVSNNNLYSSPSSGADYEAIHFRSSHYKCVNGNTIDGAELGYHGIRIEKSLGCSILNNTCKNLYGNGILLDSSDEENPSDYNSIVGNICHNCVTIWNIP